jgi:hypothetical protein
VTVVVEHPGTIRGAVFKLESQPYATILGTTLSWVIGEHYTGIEVDIDGRRYPDQSFVVLRQGSLTEWLQQLWEYGREGNR